MSGLIVPRIDFKDSLFVSNPRSTYIPTMYFQVRFKTFSPFSLISSLPNLSNSWFHQRGTPQHTSGAIRGRFWLTVASAEASKNSSFDVAASVLSLDSVFPDGAAQKDRELGLENSGVIVNWTYTELSTWTLMNCTLQRMPFAASVIQSSKRSKSRLFMTSYNYSCNLLLLKPVFI